MRFTLVQQLRVGLHAALAALVDVDERHTPAVPVDHMTIDGVVAKIRFAADEPAERRGIPLEDPIPPAEPSQFVCRLRPQPVRVAAPFVNPALDDRCDEGHGGA
jgi:hypothetical protein